MAHSANSSSISEANGSQVEQEHTIEVFSKQEIVRASPFLLPAFAGNGDDTPSPEIFDRENIYMRILLMRDKAEALFGDKDYENALLQYRDVLKVALEGVEPLTRDFYNDGYLKMLKADMKKAHRFPMFLALVSCCQRIAEIHHAKGDFTSAIDWFQEIEVLYGCFEKVYQDNQSALLKMHKTLEYVTYHMKAAVQLVQIFSCLQNTSSAAHYARLCTNIYPSRYPTDIPEIRELWKICDPDSYFRIRHPDPSRMSTFDVKDPSLQIRGVWTKIIPQSFVRPSKRHHRVTWMWRGRIYVLFGVDEKDPPGCTNGEDGWYIDFKGSAKWRHLPKIPKRLSRASKFAKRAIVFEDRAWFFSGRLEVFRFNMITETWDVVQTHADFTFPYEPYNQFDSFVELYGDKICVFAGAHDYIWIRKRVFMLLDLRTLKWEDLLLGLTINGVFNIPSLRYSTVTWVSSNEDRFFFMYGHEGQEMVSDPLKQKPADFDELLSYSFKEREWSRERLRGNFPCYRLNPCYAYHEKQDKLILFGGGTQNIPSHSIYATDGSARDLSYTMFADTFVLDLKTRIWQQVVTRNFPAWRTWGLVSIDDTGDIYMHGGMSFRNIHLGVPGKDMKFFCFTDIWQLNIDFPDSPLDEQSFLAPTTSFKSGCWRQCWVCGSIGTGYFQCQGSCRGKYIYCSAACQSSFWNTHKRLHGCRK